MESARAAAAFQLQSSNRRDKPPHLSAHLTSLAESVIACGP
jgi:hypothetical protein